MKNLKQKIQQSYIQHILEHGKRPESIFQFMKGLKAEEKDFYEHFSSFDTLEKELWMEWGEATVDKMKAEEMYLQYTSREKLLSFYYTLLEVLKAERSFIKATLGKKASQKREMFSVSTLEKFKQVFLDIAHEIINEGYDTGEVLNRPVISGKYADALWWETVLILHYWLNDTSESFENTDALIEKSVNLSFDLFGQTPVDTAIDLVKFLLQHRKKG